MNKIIEYLENSKHDSEICQAAVMETVSYFSEKALKFEYENRERLQKDYLENYDPSMGEYYDFTFQRFLIEVVKIRG